MKKVVKFGGSSLASAEPVSYTHLVDEVTELGTAYRSEGNL